MKILGADWLSGYDHFLTINRFILIDMFLFLLLLLFIFYFYRNSVLVGAQQYSVTFFLPDIFSPFFLPILTMYFYRKSREILES